MHLYLKTPIFSICPKCGKEVLPHTICWHCGYYKGIEVVDVLKKLTKKEKKQRQREMKAKEKEEGGTAKEESISWEGLSRK